MSTDTMTLEEAESGRDWRIWFGLATTLFWLLLGFQYISGVVGWRVFIFQPAEAMGGFLEGAFAPLAFLWLVIGFFLQQRELSQNTKAIRAQYEMMRRTAENAEVQARAITSNALHQRQETMLMVADRVAKQLGAVTGLLFMSSQTLDAGGEATDEQVGEMWHRLGDGDPEVFSRQLLAAHFRAQPESDFEIFYGTEIRARHSETIYSNFKRLMDAVEGCDPEGIIRDAIRGSAHGRVFQFISDHRADPSRADALARVVAPGVERRSP